MAILCHWKSTWKCGCIAWRLLKEAWHRSGNHFQIFKGKKWKCPKDLGACHSLPGFLSCQTFPYKVFTAKHLNSLHSSLVLFFLPACPSTVNLYCNLVGQTDILHLHCLTSGAHAWWEFWTNTNNETYNYCKSALLLFLCFTIKDVLILLCPDSGPTVASKS